MAERMRAGIHCEPPDLLEQVRLNTESGLGRRRLGYVIACKSNAWCWMAIGPIAGLISIAKTYLGEQPNSFIRIVADPSINKYFSRGDFPSEMSVIVNQDENGRPLAELVTGSDRQPTATIELI